MKKWETGKQAPISKDTYLRQEKLLAKAYDEHKDDHSQARLIFCNSAWASFRDDPRLMIEPLQAAIKSAMTREKMHRDGKLPKSLELEVESLEKVFQKHAEEGRHYLP